MEKHLEEGSVDLRTCNENLDDGQMPTLDMSNRNAVGNPERDTQSASDHNLNLDGGLVEGDGTNANQNLILPEETRTSNVCESSKADAADKASPIKARRPSEGDVFVKIAEGSLSNLLVYDSDSTESDSSSESDSYESVDTTDNEQEDEGAKIINKKKGVNETVRTFGELSLDDLPPVPDIASLNIGIEAKDCIHMGVISGIVERLVMVESLPNTPAYDLDTLLFLESGKKPLGYVYDVMGPVTCPIYVIRFNSVQDIDKTGVAKGLPVYSAPKTEHTQYVFLQQLMQVKGSDASWMGDNEVPHEHADFSDDEEERRTRRDSRKNLAETRKRGSLERHKDFEKDMNVKNLIDTKLHKIRDSFEPSSKKHAPNRGAGVGLGGEKRGFPFQPGGGQSCGYSQHNLNANVPSFPPMFNVPFMQAGLHLAPFPGVPFMPGHNLPPMPPPRLPIPFRANIPPPPPPQSQQVQNLVAPPQPQMQAISSQIHNIQAPMQSIPQQMQNIPAHIPCSFPNMSVPPPTLPRDMSHGQKGNQPRMLYPPDMGLPRPPPNPFVPHMPYYEPRVPRMWSYQNGPQNFQGPHGFIQPMRGNFYSKKP